MGAVRSTITVFVDDVAVIPAEFVAIKVTIVSPSRKSFTVNDQFSFVSEVVVALFTLFEMVSVDDAIPENVTRVSAVVVVAISGFKIMGAATSGIGVAVSVSLEAALCAAPCGGGAAAPPPPPNPG